MVAGRLPPVTNQDQVRSKRRQYRYTAHQRSDAESLRPHNGPNDDAKLHPPLTKELAMGLLSGLLGSVGALLGTLKVRIGLG